MRTRLAALALMLAIGGSVAAQERELLYARSLAASCAQCHGTDGRAVQGSAVVSIAGMEKNYLVTQLNAFKTGARPATVMHQISKGYSDAQIEMIANYFAAQTR